VLTAQLTIKVQPEDAEVLLDDVPFVKSDTGSSRVDAGDHKIVVSKRGFFPATRMLRMAGGDSQTVEVALEAEPVKPAAVASPVIIRQEATPGIRTPVLVSWAGAGVLAATTGVFGVLALGQSSKLEDLKNDPASLKDERDTAVSRGKTYALLTDVSGVLTLAAVGVASYITFKPAKTEKKPNAPVVVTAGLDRVGVTIPF
jgi:hypothetical protein